jgi:hypothetical protein
MKLFEAASQHAIHPKGQTRQAFRLVTLKRFRQAQQACPKATHKPWQIALEGAQTRLKGMLLALIAARVDAV